MAKKKASGKKKAAANKGGGKADKARAKFASSFKEGAGDGAFGDPIPVEDGSYKLQLLKAELGQFGGRQQIMIKYGVVDSDEYEGEVLTEWRDTDPNTKGPKWLAIIAGRFGADEDQLDAIETAQDVESLLNELAENYATARAKVSSQEGESTTFRNVTIQRPIDLDDDLLYEPSELLSGSSSASSKNESDEGDDEGDDDYEEDEEDEDEEDEGDDEEEDGDDDEDDEDDEDEDSDDEEEEIEKGDRVVVTHRKKERAGKVQSVNQSEQTARVKLDHNGKVVKFPIDEVSIETDD